LLPVFLRVAGRPCLVVGGGVVAARKLPALARAGARVTVIAPDLHPDLVAVLRSCGAVHRQREFRDSDIEDQALVVAATGSVAVNDRVAALADARRIPVNVVNHPGTGTVVFPSVVHRDPVTIAVSTGGRSPALARWLRRHLETVIPDRFGDLADLIAAYRERVRRRYTDFGERRRFWERALHGPLSDCLFHNQPDKAARVLDGLLEAGPDQPAVGEVYLVGAGPGDPDLLTFRALRLIQQADIVLYDRLVSQPILDMIPESARVVYVGKARSDHSVPQEEINERLVQYALEGNRVLRLKGGDPFIFGRGGEEIDGLARRRVPFQVVPGITAASGCAAYAGIPLTHRDHAQSCIFVTGHTRDGSLDLSWEALVQPRQTVVVYMGLTGLETLCRELIRHGMAADTPAALVAQGTTPEQRVVAASLQRLPAVVAGASVQPPTLVIIGRVVDLKDRLAWFGETGDIDARAAAGHSADDG